MMLVSNVKRHEIYTTVHPKYFWLANLYFCFQLIFACHRDWKSVEVWSTKSINKRDIFPILSFVTFSFVHKIQFFRLLSLFLCLSVCPCPAEHPQDYPQKCNPLQWETYTCCSEYFNIEDSGIYGEREVKVDSLIWALTQKLNQILLWKSTKKFLKFRMREREIVLEGWGVKIPTMGHCQSARVSAKVSIAHNSKVQVQL